MSQQTIDIGASPNDGTGDPLRDAFDKCNDNFTELYAGLVGLLDFKGSTDCSANPNYPAALKGDAYIVSVAGKIGGASGTAVDAGDWYVATADNAGGTEASVGTSWGHIEHNLTGGGTVASTTEQLTGTDAAKLATPDSVAALWEQGVDIASAGTLSVGEGGHFHVTGTTTITDIDPATDKAGRFFSLTFDGVLTLTHNASTLILPGGVNITTAAGDTALFKSEGSDAVRCVAYTRASGLSATVRGTLVKKASDQTAADYSSGATIAWDNEGTGCYDTDGVHDNSTNNTRLGTPAWARWAKVGYCVVASNVTGGSDCFAQVQLNGSDLGPGNAWNTVDLGSSTLPRVTGWTAWVPLTTPGTDYFEIKWQTSGDNSSTVHAASWAAIEFRA